MAVRQLYTGELYATFTPRSRRLPIKIGWLNVRSYRGKTGAVRETIVDRGLAFLGITESWHHSFEDICLRCSTPPGCATVNFVRPSDPEHGGIVIIHSAALVASPLPFPPIATFECIGLQLSSRERSVVLLSIYRPGSQRATGVFFEELVTVLSVLTTLQCLVVVGGDINIHVDDRGDH